VPDAEGGTVLPDEDNPADPAGTLAPAPDDKPGPLPPAVSLVSNVNGHFSVDGHTFRHVGVNEVDYVYEGGSNSDQWNDTWYLRQGGVKQIRIILANDAYDTPTIIAKLNDALGVAWSRGIRVTVALTNFYWGTHYGHDGGGGHTAVRGDTLQNYYTDTYNGIHLLNLAWIQGGYNVNYRPFVHDVVDHFKGDGRIFAWEIGNEIGAPNGHVEDAIAFYRDMARYIKGIDPGHMVTTGIICTRWLPLSTWDQKYRLYELMDYVTEHHYEPYGNAGDLDDDIIALNLVKPLVVEEFGVSQNEWPYNADHNLIMPRVSDFFDWGYAGEPVKQADAVMVWGVDFGFDLGSGDRNVGPTDQNLANDYLQLWRETADWARPSPRYSDVPPGDTFYSYIECLSNRRAVNGQSTWVDDSDAGADREGDRAGDGLDATLPRDSNFHGRAAQQPLLPLYRDRRLLRDHQRLSGPHVPAGQQPHPGADVQSHRHRRDGELRVADRHVRRTSLHRRPTGPDVLRLHRDRVSPRHGERLRQRLLPGEQHDTRPIHEDAVASHLLPLGNDASGRPAPPKARAGLAHRAARHLEKRETTSDMEGETMKKSWKLVLLTAVLVLAAWLSGERPLQATLVCDNYDGKACPHFGFRFGCTWANGSSGACVCDGPLWDCA
jgi:hypothetical protein